MIGLRFFERDDGWYFQTSSGTVTFPPHGPHSSLGEAKHVIGELINLEYVNWEVTE